MLYYLFTEIFDSFGPARVSISLVSNTGGPSRARSYSGISSPGLSITFDSSSMASVTSEDTPNSTKRRLARTMGGLFLGALSISTLLWANLVNIYVLVVLWITLSFGGIGFVTSTKYVSVIRGLPGRWKIVLQTLSLGIGAFALWLAAEGSFEAWKIEFDTSIAIPFVSTKVFNPDLGYYILFWHSS